MSGLLARRARKAAAGITDPTDIAGCSLWLDADDASTFTYSSGTVVSQWNDKSGNARQMAQSTVSLQPQRNTTVNSLDAVTFDGDDRLIRGSIRLMDTTTGELTGFCVARPSSVTGVQQLVSHDVGTGTRNPQITRMDTTRYEAVSFRSATPYIDAAGVTLATATTYVFTTNIKTTSIEVFVNQSTNGATSTGSGNLNNNASSVAIGGRADSANGENFNGVICEVVVYNSSLSAGDQDDVEQYLANKWGVTL